MLHTLRNQLSPLQPGTVPLLHYAAHGVNGAVAEVSTKHLPHQLEEQKPEERAEEVVRVKCVCVC